MKFIEDNANTKKPQKMAENIILKIPTKGLDKLTTDVNASTSAIGNMTDFQIR